ncbi:MAG: aldehyde oxygenase (deformylating) [Cyanobacteria bacterium J06639_1]
MTQVQDLATPASADAAPASAINYSDAAYCDAYSRINAIVIEGELEANQNYNKLADLLPDSADELKKLAKMENRHMKGFQACGRNLSVTPDKDFAVKFFSHLHRNFDEAATANDVVSCLVIQALLIECFAIAAYNVYIPVADDFARKITEGVVKDEYMHLNFGEVWLKGHFDDPEVKAGIEAANARNLPIVWEMFQQVNGDAEALSMDSDAILEDFMIAYGDALNGIGFTNREVMKLSAQGLKRAAVAA